LKPWTDFPIQQQQLFERVRKYIPQDAEQFSSVQYLTELGQDLCDRPLASEKDLEAYQRLAVERPTTNIILHLQGIKKARKALSLSDGIMFENHANTLADTNEEVQQSLQNLRLLDRQQAMSSSSKAKDADQICVYRSDEEAGPRKRNYLYARIDNLRRHVRKQHLKYIASDEGLNCPYLGCSILLNRTMYFLNHTALQHGLHL
jgi:hypothetical protein